MKLPETIRAAFVIARRDFTATVFSKTFLFFLLGPLFPIALGFIFGGIGAQVERNAAPATVAVVSSQADFNLLNAARNRLSPLGTERPLVALHRVDPEPDAAAQRQRLLTSADEPILGVLEGGLFSPRFTGAVTADGRTVQQMKLFVEEARRHQLMPLTPGLPVEVNLTRKSTG